MRAPHGFTLVELMVTLAIAVILLTVAIPSFQTYTLNTRQTVDINALMVSLQLARTEAVNRSKNVVVCKSSDGAACITTGAWTQGWIVFVDDDNSHTINGADAVLRVNAALSAGSALVGGGPVADYVSFKPQGMANGTVGTFTLCDSRGTSSAKGIVVSFGGRIRMANGGDTLSCT